MLEKPLVKGKLKDLFGDNYKLEIILSTETKALILIETNVDYAIVTISDFTHEPIGDYDVFIENRIDKTSNYLYDMAQMIKFLQVDNEKSVKQLQERIIEISGELVDVSKTFGHSSILGV